jgi:CDGSH iron-sulfur domain-containing protein 3
VNDPQGPIIITIKPSGSIVIPGDVRVVDAEGNELPIPPFKQPGIIKLCGCGRSGNKPFCDGSHKNPVSGER